MPPEIAYTRRFDWRTNLSASVNGRVVIAKPREGIVHRINWWQYMTMSESGDIIASDIVALCEGPMPNNGVNVGGDQNSIRDDDDIHALVVASPGTGLGTNNDAARFRHPFFPFNHGVWTVDETWVLIVTSSGVDRMSTSINYTQVKVSMKEWNRLKHGGINTSETGQLRQ